MFLDSLIQTVEKTELQPAEPVGGRQLQLRLRANWKGAIRWRATPPEAILDVPVTIRDQDKPIGTHVFTAVGLRWTAVTIDSGDNAQAALDRISIPQDVRDRIAPTASPRSSLIISDEPLHRETNYHTEFVVALHNQPQGGLAMRRAPTEMRVARGNAWGYNGFTRWFGGGYYDQRQGSQYYYQRRQGWWWRCGASRNRVADSQPNG
jgi:hypothetical protein